MRLRADAKTPKLLSVCGMTHSTIKPNSERDSLTNPFGIRRMLHGSESRRTEAFALAHGENQSDLISDRQLTHSVTHNILSDMQSSGKMWIPFKLRMRKNKKTNCRITFCFSCKSSCRVFCSARRLSTNEVSCERSSINALREDCVRQFVILTNEDREIANKTIEN